MVNRSRFRCQKHPVPLSDDNDKKEPLDGSHGDIAPINIEDELRRSTAQSLDLAGFRLSAGVNVLF